MIYSRLLLLIILLPSFYSCKEKGKGRSSSDNNLISKINYKSKYNNVNLSFIYNDDLSLKYISEGYYSTLINDSVIIDWVFNYNSINQLDSVVPQLRKGFVKDKLPSYYLSYKDGNISRIGDSLHWHLLFQYSNDRMISISSINNRNETNSGKPCFDKNKNLTHLQLLKDTLYGLHNFVDGFYEFDTTRNLLSSFSEDIKMFLGNEKLRFSKFKSQNWIGNNNIKTQKTNKTSLSFTERKYNTSLDSDLRTSKITIIENLFYENEIIHSRFNSSYTILYKN